MKKFSQNKKKINIANKVEIFYYYNIQKFPDN